MYRKYYKIFQTQYAHLFAEDDYIYGTNGNDDWQNGSALIGDWTVNNIIIAGDGDDVGDGGIYPGGEPPTAGHNVILGQGGDDDLHGAGNTDAIFGGPGNDYLSSGLGGRDLLFGGPGNDEIYGPGSRAFGGSGRDTFTGARMTAEGGGGRDTFVASDKMVITDYSPNDVLDFRFTGAFLTDLVIKADRHGNTLIKYPGGGEEPGLQTMKLLGVAPDEVNFKNILIAASDDYAGDASTTGFLPIDGTPVYGDSENGGDHDWFRIELEGFEDFSDAVRVEIRVEGITGFDPHSTIRDASGDVVARSPNYDYDDLYVVTSEEGGTYYVDVGDFDEYGTYVVTASIYEGYQFPEII